MAKAEILYGLSADGTFVFNADDEYADLWRQLADSHKSLAFGVTHPADVSSVADSLRLVWDAEGFYSEFVVNTPVADMQIRLRLAGEHNRMNALAAIAAAQALGADREDIQAGLASLRPIPGRLHPRRGAVADWVIDDSYNANPDSVQMAMEVLAQSPGRKLLVLGDLGELGTDAAALHAELGTLAADRKIERMFTCGLLSEKASLAFGADARHFTNQEALVTCLQGELQAGDVVLVKGSRLAAMDKVVDALCEEGGSC